MSVLKIQFSAILIFSSSLLFAQKVFSIDYGSQADSESLCG